MGARIVAALVIAVFLAEPAAANSDADSILLDFRKRPLAEIVEEIARATGLTVVIDENLKGEVTLASPRRVSHDEAITLLEAALRFGGYALLPAGEGMMKLLPIPEAVAGAPLVPPDSLGNRDGVVATILDLKWTVAEAIAEKLQHLVARQDVVVPYAPTNSLILVGREARVARLIGLAKLLDQEPGERQVWIRSLRYRTAADVATLLRGVLDRPGGPGRTEIYQDERTNRLIVLASQEEIDAIRDLVARMDQPEELMGALEVLPVLFRDPEDLVSLLRAMSSGSASSERPRGSPMEAALIGRSFAVEADRRTRSLLVHADPETRQLIRWVVGEIDLPPRQVQLEFALVEFSQPQSYSMSFDFFLPLSAPRAAGDLVASLLVNPSGGGLRDPDSDGRAFFFSRVGRTPLLLGTVDPRTGQPVQILVPREQATLGLEHSGVTARLISRPTLVVIAGEEHTLTIGTNIPIPVSATDSGTASGLLSVAQNIERYDTGVHVRVRPTIGQEGEIRLELYLKLDEVIPSKSENLNQVGPVLIQRQIETTVLLRRGEIAVLGMGVDQTVAERVSKVPFLGDLPFFGLFFRSVKMEVEDRLIFMTVQARAVDSLDEMQAESIRQRMNFERSQVRQHNLATSETRPFTLRIASLTSERAALSLEAQLISLGFAAYHSDWSWHSGRHYDVYVGAFGQVIELIAESQRLTEAGFRTELVVDSEGYGLALPLASGASHAKRSGRLALHP